MPLARRRPLLGVTNKLRARAEKPSTWFSTAGELSELLVHHPIELMRGERAGKATDGMLWFAQARAAKSAWLSETSCHDSGKSSSS
jgi:hypothetical protein